MSDLKSEGAALSSRAKAPGRRGGALPLPPDVTTELAGTAADAGPVVVRGAVAPAVLPAEPGAGGRAAFALVGGACAAGGDIAAGGDFAGGTRAVTGARLTSRAGQ